MLFCEFSSLDRPCFTNAENHALGKLRLEPTRHDSLGTGKVKLSRKTLLISEAERELRPNAESCFVGLRQSFARSSSSG